MPFLTLRPLLILALPAMILAPLAGGAGVALPSDPDARVDETQLRRAHLDLTPWLDEFERLPVVAGHLVAPEMASGIGPGSHLFIRKPGGLYGCTANFIWTDGTKHYLGSAGHCFVPANRRATHGPGADYNASGTGVSVCVSLCAFGGESGFFVKGVLVALGPVAYARQVQDGQVGNDFGVVEIPASAYHLMRPSMPVFHGPARSGAMTWQSTVCHFGNGVGVGETFLTHGRVGVGLGEGSRGSWTAVLAAAPGDSGSAVQTCVADATGLHGDMAAGVLTHISGGFIVGTTMTKAVQMARQANLELSLVTAS